jgi:hypothetical protein
MNDWKFALISVVIIIGVLAALLTTLIGIFAHSKNAIERGTTRDFCNNVVKTQAGNIFAIIFLLPIVLLFYLLISLIVSIRLLVGLNGGITTQRCWGAIIGSTVGACVASGILLIAGPYHSVSVWWILGVLGSIILFGSAGLCFPSPYKNPSDSHILHSNVSSSGSASVIPSNQWERVWKLGDSPNSGRIIAASLVDKKRRIDSRFRCLSVVSI